MKTALITTTINIPKVLELYRAHSEDVRFFVALDKKTPSETSQFLNALPNAQICIAGYNCSELIGWNTIARRNIAMLEALRWGADQIVVVDDDNYPIDSGYFNHFESALYCPFDGIQASSPSGWFDVGELLDPPASHRGYPYDRKAPATYSHCTQRKVGVAAGICLGDPDISAVTRIACAPIVHRVSELLRSGIVVDSAGERRPERVTLDAGPMGTNDSEVTVWRATTRGTWTVFNSQNTAIIRELAPAFFMVPQWGRYDDIYGSLLVHRLMRERGYVTHFGQPFVWQQRNRHDLLRDLRAEQFGSERILDFARWLDGFVFTGKEKVTDQMRVMFHNLPDWMPERNKIEEMVFAWCSDCDEVMK